MPSLADFVIDRTEPQTMNNRVSAEFPRLLDVLPVDKRQIGYTGYGKSEFFPRDERDNPYPGLDVVELYSPQKTGRSLRDLLFMERMHKMGSPDIGDPNWVKLKAEFYDILPAGDKDFLHRKWQQSGDPRSFQDWLNISELDQWIGALFYPPNEEWRNVKWAPEVLKWRDRAEQYLRGQ